MMTLGSWIPQPVINYLKHLPSAVVASFYYGFPSKKLKIIGVTGTDGKTTTVNLIYQILKRAGFAVAMVSTVSAWIGDEEIDTGFHVTAPEPWLLQKLMRTMVDKKIKYLVLEVTSHGLDQFRVWGIGYEVAVITNVTHEHLDYHKTFENYLRAKSKLFEKAKVAVLNKDNESYKYVATKLQSNKATKIISYGIKNEADFTLKNFSFKTKLPGEYNQYNCLAVIAATSVLGVPAKDIRSVLSVFSGVTGRMQEIDEGQDFRAIVDFAHTPNALEQALKTLRIGLGKDKKLIVVFGAAGLRDKSKRPMMGKIAGKLADFSVITAEDPRTEEVEDICGQIAKGCEEAGGKYKVIPDRQEAISYAMNLAEKGDTVVVCGKGHERSMCFGTTEYPWSDQEAVREALRGVSRVSKVSKVSNVGAQHIAPAKKEGNL